MDTNFIFLLKKEINIKKMNIILLPLNTTCIILKINSLLKYGTKVTFSPQRTTNSRNVSMSHISWAVLAPGPACQCWLVRLRAGPVGCVGASWLHPCVCCHSPRHAESSGSYPLAAAPDDPPPCALACLPSCEPHHSDSLQGSDDQTRSAASAPSHPMTSPHTPQRNSHTGNVENYIKHTVSLNKDNQNNNDTDYWKLLHHNITTIYSIETRS